MNIETLMRYKSWADSLLYRSVRQIPPLELQKDRPMLFRNILALLNHIYAMDIAWKHNLLGKPHEMQSRNPPNTVAFETLAQKQKEIDFWYEGYVSQLPDNGLSQTIHFTFIGGGTGAMSIQDILQHVVNHAAYHRGHIEGVMYQLGIEPPTTDIPVFLKSDCTPLSSA